MNFFHYINNEEIGERAFDYLFSLCDSAEMLYACNNDELDDFEIAALGTEFEVLIPAIKGVRRDQSWGMPGRIYTFALTDEFKNIIKKFGLDNELSVSVDIYLRLENLTLLQGGKVMYTTCSHEGYTDIDEEFKAKVGEFCRKEIVKTKLYAETLERYKKLPKRTRNQRAINRSKLYDLCAQVENAWERVIRDVPRWKGLTYKEYLTLAKPVFSAEVYSQLKAAGSFKGLHPTGYPRTFDEIANFQGTPDFRQSELMCKILTQLDMLKTVFFIEEGQEDWHIDGEKERMPSIIINEVKKD